MSAHMQEQLQTAADLFQSGQPEQAAQLCQQVLAADPGQHQASHLLAMMAYQQSDRDAALAWWERAAAAMPSDPVYRNNCGEMLRQLGRPEQAERQYVIAVALRPDFAEAHNNLGLSLLDRKKYAEAKQSFATAINLKPDFCQAYNNLGSALKSLGDGADAFDCFLRATELDPDYAMAWNNIGLSCHEFGQLDESEECFRTAIRLAPRLVDTFANLARLLRQRNRLDEALSLGEQGLSLNPSIDLRKQLYRLLGDILRNLGRFADSRQYFSQLQSLEPGVLQHMANAELVFTDKPSSGYYSISESALIKPNQGMRRVALFAPGDHYLNMLWGLKRAFERQGIVCVMGWPLLPPDALTIFLKEFSPDLVIEINRTRHQARVLPPHIKHIAWIQDGTLAFDQDLAHFGGSDRTYFMAQPEAVGYDPALLERDEHYGFLLPAADAEVYYPLSEARYMYDFSFAGFIPPPPAQAMSATRLLRHGKEWLLDWPELEKLLREAQVFQWSVGDSAYPMIHQGLAKHLGLSPEAFGIPDDAYPNITSMMRLIDRKDLLEQALDVSDSLLINGPETWLKWPRFAPHHKGMLYDARELANSYRSSRLVLHNGVSALHPRTFECLACGSALLINRCYTDDKPGSILNYLTPGEHYIEYELPNAGATLREALGKPEYLAQIRRAANAKVLAQHTWDHRVKQILSEL